MHTNNKDLSRRLFEEGWNKADLNVLKELNGPDFRLFDPYVHVPGNGLEASQGYFEAFHKVFPDLSFRIDEQVAEGDTVVNFLSCTGTHEGEFLGLPPTHVKATIPAVVRLRFDHGKVVESWTLWDALGFMRAAGAAGPIAEKEMAAATR